MARIFIIAAILILVTSCKDLPTTQDTVNPGQESPNSVNTSTSQPSLTPTLDYDSMTEDECKAHRGRWEILGFRGPGCNSLTTDGGKECTSSKDCESVCLAEGKLLDSEVLEQLNAQENEISGTCSWWRYKFGCYVRVEDSKYGLICVD